MGDTQALNAARGKNSIIEGAILAGKFTPEEGEQILAILNEVRRVQVSCCRQADTF